MSRACKRQWQIDDFYFLLKRLGLPDENLQNLFDRYSNMPHMTCDCLRELGDAFESLAEVIRRDNAANVEAIRKDAYDSGFAAMKAAAVKTIDGLMPPMGS